MQTRDGYRPNSSSLASVVISFVSSVHPFLRSCHLLLYLQLKHLTYLIRTSWAITSCFYLNILIAALWRLVADFLAKQDPVIAGGVEVEV